MYGGRHTVFIDTHPDGSIESVVVSRDGNEVKDQDDVFALLVNATDYVCADYEPDEEDIV